MKEMNEDEREKEDAPTPDWNEMREKSIQLLPKMLQDNPQPSRCLGIFGLSTRTRERDLQALFEKYGPLDNVQVRLIHVQPFLFPQKSFFLQIPFIHHTLTDQSFTIYELHIIEWGLSCQFFNLFVVLRIFGGCLQLIHDHQVRRIYSLQFFTPFCVPQFWFHMHGPIFPLVYRQAGPGDSDSFIFPTSMTQKR